MSAAGETQNVDLLMRSGDRLNEERKSSIRTALQKYRERVLEQNLSALRTVIDEIESEPPRGPPWPPYLGKQIKCTEDEAPQKRIEYLRDAHSISLDPEDPTVTTVSDLLSEDRRESLIQTNRLDGVTHGEVDIAARNAWIEDVEQRISTAEGPDPRPTGLPADLKYLMTLVRGICGPGLPETRFYNQFKFLSDLEADKDTETEAGWIAVPNTQEEVDSGELGDFLPFWNTSSGEYTVAMAVGIGQCSFAVYCREKETGEENSNREWRWRFGLQEESEFDLYDTVENFLGWYAEGPQEE